METKTYVALGFVIVAGFLVAVQSQGKSNCQTGRGCDNCPEGYYGYVDINPIRRIKVCCLGCRSKYFTFTSKPRPACTCHFDRVVNEPSCWKGEQCCACEGNASINGLPVCCALCGNSSMTLSGTSCACGTS